MRLSEAIEKGIGLVPAGRSSYFVFEGATGEDYIRGVAHHRPLVCADVLGTALVGMAGDAIRAATDAYEGPHGGPHGLLTTLYPALRVRSGTCPVCHNAASLDGRRPMLFTLIWHLQDAHRWSRAQVAGWLRGQGH